MKKPSKAPKNILTAIDLGLSYGPLTGFITYGLATGEVVQKVALSFTMIIAIVFAVLGALSKIKSSTVVWGVLILVCIFLPSVMWCVYVVGGSIIVDDLAVKPILKTQKEKYKIRKELYKSGGLDNGQ